MRKPVSLVVSVFLLIVALAHAARLVFQVPVTVGNVPVPLWLSALPVLFLPALAILLRNETRHD